MFGFSRGAAAARTFVHEATRPRYNATSVTNAKTGNSIYYDLDSKRVGQQKLPARGHLGLLFEEKKITIKVLKVRFVGLYDTVSSYGVNFEDDTTDEDDIAEINLRAISHPTVKNVVQIAAAHEWRKNFNLTNINSAGSKGLELTLPGCHCDIGGAYETMVYKQRHYVALDSADKAIVMRRGHVDKEFQPAIEKNKKPLVESGWYTPEQLTYITLSPGYSVIYDGTRLIDKRYSYIPLQFMCRLATEKGSKFNLEELTNLKKFGIPEKAGTGRHILDYVKSRLEQYMNDVKDADFQGRRNIKYNKYLDVTNEKILSINLYTGLLL